MTTDPTLAALAEQAKELIDRWTTNASQLAADTQAGTVTADEAVQAWVEAGTVAMNAATLALAGLVRLGSIGTGTSPGDTVQSEPFTVAPAPTPRAVTLGGPLTKMNGSLGAGDVAIEPSPLPAAVTQFRLVVKDPTGKPSGVYTGTVLVGDAGPGQVSVPVTIEIP